jgi:hypothetical protein
LSKAKPAAQDGLRQKTIPRYCPFNEMLSLKTDVFVPTERNQQKIFRKI